VEFGVDELRALARKYQALEGLRARRDAGGSGGGGQVAIQLRALAAEFPGCLRELDTLGLAELARRAQAVEVAARGGARESWMAWIWGYHQLMRAALAVRRGERAQDGDGADEAFAAEVLAPPEGRVGIVVLRRLAAAHGRPAREIAAALFPVRRPSPYAL
jgi:hypothetical protein